jgi:hypothetical protein
MLSSGGPNDDAMSVAATAANPGLHDGGFGVIQNNDGFGRGLNDFGGTSGAGAAGAEGAVMIGANAFGGADGFGGGDRWKRERHQQLPNPGTGRAGAAADRWAEEQMFEEDVRAVLSMMRPNRRERLRGWSEYRTGGAHFRVTVSWDEEFEASQDAADPMRTCTTGKTRIPHLADVLEAVIVGSALHDDDLTAAEEFDLYRGVLREVYHRLDDLQSCYE